jgi:PAS domain S-box-containing protein
MEENLKKSHSLLESTIKIQEDILVYSIDVNYKYLYFNKAHSDRMKSVFNSNVQLGENVFNITSKEVLNVIKANYDRALQGETHSNIQKLGTAYYENFFNPIFVNNNIIGINCLSKNITNDIESTLALKESEDKYHALFKSNRDSITIFRINSDGNLGNFIEANEATTELFGYSEQELTHLNVNDLESVSPLERKEIIKTLLANGKIDFETSIKTKKGETRIVEIKSLLINYLNEPAVMKITRDITDRKYAERDSNKAHKKLTNILKAIPDLLFEVGIEGKIYHYHSHHNDLLIAPPEQFVGKLIQDILPEKASTICMNAIQEAHENGWSGGQNYYLHLENGKHWFELFVSAINENENEDKHFILLARDITTRKKAEESLIANEAFLNQTQLIANIGSYCVNLTTGNWTSSDVLNTIFGIDTSYEKDINGWQIIIHPEWRKTMMGYYTNEVINKKNDFNKEYKILRISDHTERWVHGIGKIMYNKRNEPTHLIGTIQDITEKRLIQESLRENEDRIRNLLDSTDGIVWEADAKTFNFTFVSKQAERLLGFPIEDWYNPGFWENILHPEDRDSTIDYRTSQTQKMQSHESMYRVIAKNGSIIWLNDIVNVVVEDEKPSLIRGVMFNITQQKQIEDALRESEEKYRKLVENSPDAVVIYIDDKIVFINQEGIRMIGAVNREEIIGKSVLQFIHPDSMESVKQRMVDVIRHSNASDIAEEKFIDIHGNSIDVELKAIPTIYEQKDAVQVIIHNITERKRTQQKIRQLSQAVEQSPVSIIITNTEGKIEYVNPKFSETTGYNFTEVVGKNPRFLKSGHTSVSEYKDLWQTLSAGNEWHGEFHNITKNGERIWESASISPILNAQGKITHYIAIKEDITNRKKAEEELIQAKEKAEESDRLKLAFLANMSHEIRTPMNGILGFTELLKSPNLSTEVQQEYLEIIEKSGIRMLNIINDIISISKVESGQVDVFLSETNVNEQIDYINNFFKPEVARKGIQLFTNVVLSNEKAVILTDREKTYAIFTNLVKNAIKFTDSGSIELGYTQKENYLEFFVKDSGLGISTSQQKIIFERFRQADDTISRSHEGSGLGLAISKAYVEILGGKIWVESTEKKGSTFYFTIPFDEKSESDTIISKKVIETEKEENEIKNLKILIVEDDPISKLLITIAVKPYSKEILKVSTGIEAIETCLNNPDIDLVMMDINMPEMGGHEATQKIRMFNKELIIIAQTANGMQSDRDDAIAVGCTDYISKPVNIAALNELIQKYFKK